MAGSRLARRRFSEQTGFASPQRWETMFLPHVLNGWRVARAAQRLNPLFVFGHEVTSYGLATAWVSGAPRILFPWGADVMTTAEVSPWHFRMARFALQAADLIVPSSHTAARHIRARFGIAPEKVRPVSWGAELGQFRPASPDERARTCRQWRIDPSAHIVLNARRFLPLYNCESVVRAFIRIARARTDCHFVLLGGRDTDAYVDAAIREVASAVPAAADRFTFVRDNIPLADCASLMNCADAFVSVCDRVDMRSKSVVEAAAAGGVPIIGEAEEYRYMEARGFSAAFVPPRDPEAIAAAITSALDDPRLRERVREQNTKYLAEYEDSDRQMGILLDVILRTVDEYRRVRRSR
jgi:glycosyltransferase involved in cell wall biosynthesis